MLDLKIAYGDSRKTKRWVNKKITWPDLVDQFRVPRKTVETVAEYAKLAKEARDNAKDKGGFVLGHLKGGQRGKGTVEARSGITLDADHATPEFLDRVETVATYPYAIYSTHSHTPDQPRFRLVIPLARAVTPDEYMALARLVADEIGMDFFDDTTYEPERLMYWPSCPADGEYVFIDSVGGDLLDPDTYLAKLSHWRDCSLLPTSSRESAVRERSAKEQQDPLTKAGVVGAFCRSYTIEEAIEKFLPDIYQPSLVDNRYDYVPADSSAGVITYGGKFAYSHHATDHAAVGKLLNAFDLVRVHRFTDLAEPAAFKAMAEFAVKDPAVKKVMADDRKRNAAADFEGADWEQGLTHNRSGKIENTLMNICRIMENDPQLSQIRYNMLASAIYADNLPWERSLPAWRDSDTAQLVAYVEANYGEFTAHRFDVALTVAAQKRMYHPIRDYLNALPAWDQVPRVDTVFIDYLGAEDSEYVRAVTRKVLVAAVARIRQPGIKFDSIPVLNGSQGIGKSTLIGKLGREWYSDSLSIADMKDKTAAEKLQGYWVLELSEMAGIKKVDVEAVKAFASRQDDKYRPSYGRFVEDHPRECVVIGTTNNGGGFLRDVTGNRRFWPVRLTAGSKRPWDLTSAEVDQIWAEALVLYGAGEELFLRGELAAIAIEEQRDALETDDREGLVAVYLETLLPENWDQMDTVERVEYLDNPDNPTHPVGVNRRTQVSNIEIWCECFRKPREAIKKADSYEIEAIIQGIGGWQRYESKTGKRSIPIYGIQRIYVRD